MAALRQLGNSVPVEGERKSEFRGQFVAGWERFRAGERGMPRVAAGETVAEHRNMVVAGKRFFVADSVPIVPTGVAGF